MADFLLRDRPEQQLAVGAVSTITGLAAASPDLLTMPLEEQLLPLALVAGLLTTVLVVEGPAEMALNGPTLVQQQQVPVVAVEAPGTRAVPAVMEVFTAAAAAGVRVLVVVGVWEFW